METLLGILIELGIITVCLLITQGFTIQYNLICQYFGEYCISNKLRRTLLDEKN